MSKPSLTQSAQHSWAVAKEPREHIRREPLAAVAFGVVVGLLLGTRGRVIGSAIAARVAKFATIGAAQSLLARIAAGQVANAPDVVVMSTSETPDETRQGDPRWN